MNTPAFNAAMRIVVAGFYVFLASDVLYYQKFFFAERIGASILLTMTAIIYFIKAIKTDR